VIVSDKAITKYNRYQVYPIKSCGELILEALVAGEGIRTLEVEVISPEYYFSAATLLLFLSRSKCGLTISGNNDS